MNANQIQHGQIKATEQRIWGLLGDDADVFATYANNNPHFLREVVKFALNGAFVESCSLQEARKIMGENFFGLEEAGDIFGREYGIENREFLYFYRVPYHPTTLHACKETHVLSAIFPTSIQDIMDQNPGLINVDRVFASSSSHNIITENSKQFGWRLVRKGATPNSTGLSSNQQKRLYDSAQAHPLRDEEMADFFTYVYSCVGYFRKTGKWICDGDISLRCSHPAHSPVVRIESNRVISLTYSVSASSKIASASIRRRCIP